MSSVVLKVISILALPVFVFLAGAWIMAAASGRERVDERLQQHAAAEDRRPLNQRFRYDRAAVERHWGALDEGALEAERTFLELDLVFPLAYGAAFAFSLLMAWASLGRPLNPAWLLVIVGLTVVSDWVENLVLLEQLRRYLSGGAEPLQSAWIATASVATTLKLLSFTVMSIVLLALSAKMLLVRQSS